MCIIVHVNEKKIVSRERSRLRSVVVYKRASGRERKFSKFPYEYTKQTNKNKPSSFKRTNSKASSSRQFPIRTAELEYVLLLNVVVVYVVVEIFQNAIFRNSFLFGGPSLLLSLVVRTLTLSSLSLYLSLSVSL